MNDLSVAEDIGAYVAVDPVLGEQVDLPAEDLRKFVTHPLQGDQAHSRFGRQFDQHIDVTVWSEIAAQGRTEDRQLAHRMGATESLKVSLRNVKLRIHGDVVSDWQVSNLPSDRCSPNIDNHAMTNPGARPMPSPHCLSAHFDARRSRKIGALGFLSGPHWRDRFAVV
jgi:hypothetical protein